MMQAEQIVIGSILTDQKRYDEVVDIISVDDFLNRLNGEIFKTIESLIATGQAVDVITVAEKLSENGDDHLSYLTDLSCDASSANYKGYAQVMARDSFKQKAIVRLEFATEEIKGLKEVADIESALASIPEQVQSKEQEFKPFEQMLKEAILRIDERQKGEAKVGLRVGFKDVDNRLLGLEDDDFVIIAGRPSMGKTTYAMNIAENVSMSGGNVLVFSMEMNEKSLLDRMLSSMCGIPANRMKTGLELEDYNLLQMGVGKLKKANINIIDRPSMHVKHVANIARKFDRNKKLDLIIIDYLQLMRGDNKDRVQEISEISRALKALAKTVKCPVIALSQLSRGVEQRPNKRPINSDLRESGQIEQDADIIQFLYRDEVYNEDSPSKGVAEVITTKFRNGEIGTDFVLSELNRCRFKDMPAEYIPPEPDGKSQGYSYKK